MDLFTVTEAQLHVYEHNTKCGEDEKGIAHKQKYTQLQRCLKLFAVLKQVPQTLNIQAVLWLWSLKGFKGKYIILSSVYPSSPYISVLGESDDQQPLSARVKG